MLEVEILVIIRILNRWVDYQEKVLARRHCYVPSLTAVNVHDAEQPV